MRTRRLPVGAEAQPDGGVHFRVWAPGHRVDVLIGADARPLEPEANGYHAALVSSARPHSRYRYRLDGGDAFPDPASRAQPDGSSGPSEVIDPSAYAWKDAHWRGVGAIGQVIYELHVGTFTKEGTFASAAADLPRLKRLGVTVLEVMPIAEFPGTFGWGYDGVDLFAPFHHYGAPDDARRFVDAAHALGLGVILDVVYNHVGPAENYLRCFSEQYFSTKYRNEWGEPLNFDGEGAGPVRELFIANAGYWIDEYHFDGLRLDATQAMEDKSPTHVIAAIAARAREVGRTRGCDVLLIGENERQEAKLARPVARGGGLDALWNDDFHHAAVSAATGHSEAYYSDTAGTPQQLVAAVKWGFLFQGQRYGWQRQRRGTSALDLPSTAFVAFLENHDQVANSLRGARLWQRTTPGAHRALVALLLLAPQTPMLFQGEEFNSAVPFLYFADHRAELAAKVQSGRARFLAQFRNLDNRAAAAVLDDPAARATFERCKLDRAARERNDEVRALYGDLLRLRRDHVAFAQQRGDHLHGTVIGPQAFALRFFVESNDKSGDRLVVVNLGPTLRLASIADPLVAPPEGARWEVAWSSEDPAYGGDGVGPVEAEDGWRIGGNETTVLAPVRVGNPGREVSDEGGQSSGVASRGVGWHAGVA